MIKEDILKWLNGSGYGSGYGRGYGSGYGSGDGSGDGSGHGSGYGRGDGSGNGWGNGWGYGYKILKHNGEDVYYVDGMPTIITHINGTYAKGYTVGEDCQLTKCFIAKDEYTNKFAHGSTLRKAVEALQEKVYQDVSEEERLQAFRNAFKPDEKYKGTEFFKWHNILTGSCLFGREQFVKNKGLDLNAEYTVQEFIGIVENDYGGEIIQKLKEGYEQ